MRDPDGYDVEDDHERGADEEGGATPLVIGKGAEEEDADDQSGRAGRVEVRCPGSPETDTPQIENRVYVCPRQNLPYFQHYPIFKTIFT